MPEKEKIDATQLMFILVPTIISTAILIIPNVTSAYARQNGWASVLLASVIGFWVVLVMAKLCMRYPGLTFPEIGGKMFGRWFEVVAYAGYSYIFLLYVTISTNEIIHFTALYAQPRTPTVVTIFLFLIFPGIAAWAGIEVIGRAAGFMLPLAQIFVTILTLLLIPEMKLDYLKPVLAMPYTAVLKGAMIPAAWLSEVYILGFIFPWIRNPERGLRSAMWAVITLVSTMVLICLDTFLVLGPLTGKMSYAFYTAVRQVSIADFIERIDPVVVSVWLYGVFIKVSIFLWLLCTTFAGLFRMRHYRPMVLPMTLLCMVGALWTFPDAASMQTYLTYTFPPNAMLFQVAVPTLLYAVDWIRGKRGKPA
ncbi:GerAB/ArcD/ProY family transporter [Alicyclobacillus macrosporangiidus]|uniref:GerAB/ArcD/ProY family transporter n=1 Tax=Alicyclobacillus macrosporangiidus TaxID=392015 RepID=UPI00049714FE|nr:endospore germination permease [Alicyclobacillus macrosporangiidus]